MLILLPDLLVDHNLGTIAIPKLFCDAGFKAVTVSALFGRSDVQDVEIMERVGKDEMLFVTRDANIRRNKIEREAIFKHNVRMVCLTKQDHTTAQMVDIFAKHMKRIKNKASTPGPWVLAISLSQAKDITRELKARMVQ